MRVKLDRQKMSQGRGQGDEVSEYNKLKALEDSKRAGIDGSDMYCRTHDYKVF
jgi:hypothetical protein